MTKAPVSSGPGLVRVAEGIGTLHRHRHTLQCVAPHRLRMALLQSHMSCAALPRFGPPVPRRGI